MMLPDSRIRWWIDRGEIGITPAPADRAFQPASVDLRLGANFRTEHGVPVESYEFINLKPGQCLLAATAETITVPAWLVARVEGKSTWGRNFLMVHSTAGFIDPGFTGQITLELKNLSTSWLQLPVGCYIAQISFQRLEVPAARPYGHTDLGSHYQGQQGATVAAKTS